MYSASSKQVFTMASSAQIFHQSTLIALLVLLVIQCNCNRTQTDDNQPSDQSKINIERRALHHLDNQQVNSGESYNLEAPVAMNSNPAFVQGPAVDLVGLNRRRFELEHEHQHEISSTDKQLRIGKIIEANIAALPEQMLNRMPAELSREILESLASDQSLITDLMASGANPIELADDDPDGASIERLTKSCLTVHASSASPEQLNVTFHLYTKNNPHAPFIMRPTISRQELIKSSPFDPTKPVKWITHGFHTNVDKSEWMVEAKDKILAFEDANVILTDWRRGASPALAFYPKAAANAHVVSKIIVKILRRLRNDIDFGQVHLIGHSLGAHIMGFVGSSFTEEFLQQQQQQLPYMNKGENGQPYWQSSSKMPRLSNGNTNALIGRITACDPALPCFGPTSSAPNSKNHAVIVQPTLQDGIKQQGSPAFTVVPGPTSGLLVNDVIDWTPTLWTHLRPDSAIVVEVMHSNPGVMGYADPLGDFDFFPNGLDRQPGCGSTNETPKSHKVARIVPRHKRQVISRVQSFMGNILGSVMPSYASRRGSRLTNTINRFIKPIKDFVNGNTCSHHRSVEYMVESMYYERIPQDRRLDKNLVCQMVGYRCTDYHSFKKGFCFKCNNEMECRAFMMPVTFGHNLESEHLLNGNIEYQQNFADRYSPAIKGRSMSIDSIGPSHMLKFVPRVLRTQNDSQSYETRNVTGRSRMKKRQKIENNNQLQAIELNNNKNDSDKLHKRVLPTFNHYNENYKPPERSQYYFDTRPSKNFCINHYHLHIKYRWFRIREGVNIDGLLISGTLANVSIDSQVVVNKFTHHSYTLLLTHSVFLGQVESLTIFGDQIKPKLIEYIELTFMSNLDPRIRSLGSARLCRAPKNVTPEMSSQGKSETKFVRCSGAVMV